MVQNIPIYLQIHDKIKEDIEKGVWSIGDRLPSERELALKFDVSRMTLRQAIQTLADEGILERKIGSGTYVARKKVQETMTGTTSVTEITLYKTLEAKSGHKIGHSNQTISAVQASEQIAEYLEIKRGDAILRVRQVSYFENGLPFEYVRTQYAGSRFEFYLEK